MERSVLIISSVIDFFLIGKEYDSFHFIRQVGYLVLSNEGGVYDV